MSDSQFVGATNYRFIHKFTNESTGTLESSISLKLQLKLYHVAGINHASNKLMLHKLRNGLNKFRILERFTLSKRTEITISHHETTYDV